MKKILTIVIPTVIVLCVAGGLLMWYFRPMNRINRAFEKEDYEQVVELFGSLKKDGDIASVRERLEDIARKYYKDYLSEKMSYREVTTYYDLIQDEIFRKDKSIKKQRKEIDEICESRESYKQAVECMEAGDYLGAIEYFGLVSELDENYKKLSDESMAKCRELYVDDVLSEADGLISKEDYDKAETIITDAMDIFPDDDRLNDKLSEIIGLKYSDIEGKWSVTYDFGDLIAEELGLKGYKLYFPAELIYEFMNDTFHMYVNADSIKPALDEMTADEASMEALYVVAEQYGVNKFEADVLVTLMYGGSYSAFLMDRYGSEISDALDSFNYQSVYSADSKKVYIGTADRNTDNYYCYEQDDAALILEEYIGSMNPMKLIEYPLTLKRKIK